jgi:hypothetical protein
MQRFKHVRAPGIRQDASPADMGGMRTRTRLLVPMVSLVVLLASISAMFASSASASPTRASAVAMPTPAAARTLVSQLWKQRDGALTLLSANLLPPYETGIARELDDANVSDAACTCQETKDPHPVMQVIPLVPKRSVQPAFFAEVQTTNDRTKQHPWYVVALAPEGGRWKITFVTFATNAAAPPLPELGTAGGYTGAISAATHVRMTRMARFAASSTAAHEAKPTHTQYGATVVRRPTIEPGNDGVYGVALGAGKLLSCFTVHDLATSTLSIGLAQGPEQVQYGPTLAPGTYRSVTVDTATPQCMVGTGSGSAPGTLRMQDGATRLAATGVKL